MSASDISAPPLHEIRVPLRPQPTLPDLGLHPLNSGSDNHHPNSVQIGLHHIPEVRSIQRRQLRRGGYRPEEVTYCKGCMIFHIVFIIYNLLSYELVSNRE